MDPLLISVATAVAGKAGEAAFKGGAAAARNAIEAIKHRFGGHAHEAEVLARVERDDAPVEQLAAVIERASESDPALRRMIEEAVGRPIQITNTTTNVTFNNNFAPGGEPNNIVQGETINIQNLG